jgi:DNA-binding NarL/FixJ family response regulator
MSKKVLIAETNKILLEALQGILLAAGFNVVATTSQKSEVAPLSKETKPDLLLFDFHLSGGGWSGLSELEAIKEDLPELKILVLGFHDAVDDFVSKIKKAGGDGFFSKFGDHALFLKTLNILFQ